MEEDPISEAIKHIPINEVDVEGGISDKEGAFIKAEFERELKKDISIGAEGELGQKSGWSVLAFFRKKFK